MDVFILAYESIWISIKFKVFTPATLPGARMQSGQENMTCSHREDPEDRLAPGAWMALCCWLPAVLPFVTTGQKCWCSGGSGSGQTAYRCCKDEDWTLVSFLGPSEVPEMMAV